MRASPKSETSIKKGRSRITNNRSMFPRRLDGQAIDLRGQWTRRVRDLVRSYTSDAGGDDAITEGMRALIRRVALLQSQMERMEAMWATEDGEASPTSLDAYQRCANTTRRLIESAGLKTRAMKTVPDLQTYLKQKVRERSLDNAETDE